MKSKKFIKIQQDFFKTQQTKNIEYRISSLKKFLAVFKGGRSSRPSA
jgi:hypothetical protein